MNWPGSNFAELYYGRPPARSEIFGKVFLEAHHRANKNLQVASWRQRTVVVHSCSCVVLRNFRNEAFLMQFRRRSLCRVLKPIALLSIVLCFVPHQQLKSPARWLPKALLLMKASQTVKVKDIWTHVPTHLLMLTLYFAEAWNAARMTKPFSCMGLFLWHTRRIVQSFK